MRRNTMVQRPGKPSKKSDKKHRYSAVLAADSRLQAPPRRVETLHAAVAADGTEVVLLLKIYGPEVPGSELVTLSCVHKTTGLEAELRFDERFPVSIRFRKQSDDERLAYAREQIARVGGFELVLDAFRSTFPKFGV